MTSELEERKLRIESLSEQKTVLEGQIQASQDELER